MTGPDGHGPTPPANARGRPTWRPWPPRPPMHRLLAFVSRSHGLENVRRYRPRPGRRQCRLALNEAQVLGEFRGAQIRDFVEYSCPSDIGEEPILAGATSQNVSGAVIEHGRLGAVG